MGQSLGRLRVLESPSEKTEGDDGPVDKFVLDHQAGQFIIQFEDFVDILVLLAFNNLAELLATRHAYCEKQEQ